MMIRMFAVLILGFAPTICLADFNIATVMEMIYRNKINEITSWAPTEKAGVWIAKSENKRAMFTVSEKKVAMLEGVNNNSDAIQMMARCSSLADAVGLSKKDSELSYDAMMKAIQSSKDESAKFKTMTFSVSPKQMAGSVFVTCSFDAL